MLFLALAAGGAAALEVHRAIASKASSDPDVVAMRQRERELKEALLAAQQALSQEKQQRERENMAAETLSASVRELRTKTADLQAAKDALEDHSKLLLRRFEQLERDAASLQDGNDTLTQQVETLKLESDAEVARTLGQVEELKQEVAAAVQGWGGGALSAEAFLAEMGRLGVEVQCAPAQLPALPAAELLARDDLQLAYDPSWTSKMQLVTESRERMSRLLTSAAARQSDSGLPPRPAGALTFPAARTPPRDAGMSRRLDMSGFSASALTPRSARAAGQVLMEAAEQPAAPTQQPKPAAPQRAALQSIDNVVQPSAPSQPKAQRAAVKRKPMMKMPRLQFVNSDDDFGAGSQDLVRL